MDNDSIHLYTYDAENRVVSMDSGAASYTYGPDGLRIKKVSGGTTTTYVYSGLKVIAEYTGSTPALSKEYIYAGDSLFATVTPGTPENVIYRHMDHLSGRLETNASGGTTRTFGHYPFGETWYENGSNKRKFTTYERDDESQLDYANYRYYMPRLGRFLTPDPVSGDIGTPQSMGRYAYVSGDPVALSDPSGLCGEASGGIKQNPLNPKDTSAQAFLLQSLLLGYDVAFPFAGQSKAGSIFSIFLGSLGFNTTSRRVANSASQTAAADNPPLGTIGASGGEMTNESSSFFRDSVANVAISPGASTGGGNPNTIGFTGSGVKDSFVNGTSQFPADVPFTATPDAGHDIGSIFAQNLSKISDFLKSNKVGQCGTQKVFLPLGAGKPGDQIMLGSGGGDWYLISWTCVKSASSNMWICIVTSIRKL